MDEGTIKAPIPKCRLYGCFVWGGVAVFVGSDGQKQNMVYNTTQQPLIPPHTHTAKHCLE
jgi:hypothetical protein